MATMNEFRDYSEVMARGNSPEDEIETAKVEIMGIMSQFTEEEHMHMAVDILASLAHRDYLKFMAVMLAASETAL
jgi:hypothetical protein